MSSKIKTQNAELSYLGKSMTGKKRYWVKFQVERKAGIITLKGKVEED